MLLDNFMLSLTHCRGSGLLLIQSNQRRKEGKWQTINGAIIAMLESIVSVSTYEDFERWEPKSEKVYDMP